MELEGIFSGYLHKSEQLNIAKSSMNEIAVNEIE